MDISGKLGSLNLAIPLARLYDRLGDVWFKLLVDTGKAAGELVVGEAKMTTLFQDSQHPERGSGGQLRASITTQTYSSRRQITTIVWPGMEYGRYVHDGTVDTSKIAPKKARPMGPGDPRFIFPVNTRALRFFIGGEEVFAAWARKGRRKARPFLYDALGKKQKEITTMFADTVSLLMQIAGR
ncbi:MAG: hypothetical protein ACWGQW_14240 [bacterium]